MKSHGRMVFFLFTNIIKCLKVCYKFIILKDTKLQLKLGTQEKLKAKLDVNKMLDGCYIFN